MSGKLLPGNCDALKLYAGSREAHSFPANDPVGITIQIDHNTTLFCTPAAPPKKHQIVIARGSEVKINRSIEVRCGHNRAVGGIIVMLSKDGETLTICRRIPGLPEVKMPTAAENSQRLAEAIAFDALRGGPGEIHVAAEDYKAYRNEDIGYSYR